MAFQVSSVELNFSRTHCSKFFSLSFAEVSPVSVFTNMTPDCKPIAVRLLCDDIMEASCSPWRAQPLVVSDDNLETIGSRLFTESQ